MMSRIAVALFLVAVPSVAEAQDGWSAPIPFLLEKNLMLVDVSVGGGAPMRFILDTGAYSMLDTRAADALGIARRLVGRTDGIGAQQQPVFVPETPYSLALGGHAVVPRQPLIVPLAAVEDCFNAEDPGKPRGAPQAIRGILGREFFDRYVVELDYPRRQLRVRDPAGWQVPADASPIALELEPQHFFTRATLTALDGRTLAARLQIDTGYAVGLSLNRPFVEANRLWPAPGSFESAPVCGLAGPVGAPSEIATMAGLSIGNASAGPVETEFSHTQEISAADGFVGGGFFKDYRVTIALERKTMLLDR